MTADPSKQQSVFRNPNVLAGLKRVGGGLDQKSHGKVFHLNLLSNSNSHVQTSIPMFRLVYPFPDWAPPQKIQIRITLWKICLPIAGAPIAQNNKATANRRAPGGHAEWGRGASGDKANRPASVLTSISTPLRISKEHFHFETKALRS